MKELSRAERFNKARTIYNQHGSQTFSQVHDDTGITISMLEDLESYKSERNPSCQKIAILAHHYGVSADYLLGISEAATLDADIQAVCKFTHLTEKAIDGLKLYEVYTFINNLFEYGLEDNIKKIRPWVIKAVKHSVRNDSIRKQIAARQPSYKSPTEEIEPNEDWYIEQIMKKLSCVQKAASEMYSSQKELFTKMQDDAVSLSEKSEKEDD